MCVGGGGGGDTTRTGGGRCYENGNTATTLKT